MGKIAFDTLKAAELLQPSAFDQNQAKRLWKYSPRLWTTLKKSRELGTERDIKELRLALRIDMSDLRSEINPLVY